MTLMRQITDFLSDTDWSQAGQSFWRGFRLALVVGVLTLAVPGPRPDRGDPHFAALGLARDHLFNFVAWEASTLADKTAIALVGPQRYLSDIDRARYVRDYLQLVTDIDTLELAVEQIYINPDIRDPDAASAALRAERDRLRARQREQQALAESIIEAQIAETLVDYGLGIGGQVLPPVSIRFTSLPTILIVSPRDRIERTGSYALEHGLTVDQMTHIEGSVDRELDVSSLIVPLGGLAVYPAMLVETGYLPSVFTVGAHEWTHHLLAFFPLGLNYGRTPELYTINETVASIVGEEIGWAVLSRYYPDLAGDPPDYTPRPPAEQAAPEEAAGFDFRAEMRATRIEAERLLAEGKIEEAERYMEARRRIFVQNGYAIRKLNQAYFAFYGSYADEPGATGADPIGPALRDLRYYSGSLAEYLATVRGLTTFDQIQAALASARRQHEAGR